MICRMKIHFQQCGCRVAKKDEENKAKKKSKKAKEDDRDDNEGDQGLFARLRAPLKLPALVKKKFRR
jgi:hypothetical protein